MRGKKYILGSTKFSNRTNTCCEDFLKFTNTAWHIVAVVYKDIIITLLKNVLVQQNIKAMDSQIS